MGIFSLLAVVPAALGIYAVVSFSVARRAGELGTRIALGAERSRVVRMVVREVVATVVVGLAVGAGVAALVAPRARGLLFGVRPLDPTTFVGATAPPVGPRGPIRWKRSARPDTAGRPRSPRPVRPIVPGRSCTLPTTTI